VHQFEIPFCPIWVIRRRQLNWPLGGIADLRQRPSSEHRILREAGLPMLGGVADGSLAIRLDLKENDDLDQRLGRYSELPFSLLVNKSG
jgi:hypothetical protein